MGMFQSPSFRGGSTPGDGCNAFLCVHSIGFQSPSFRGGSTPVAMAVLLAACLLVSIPFVSGREHSRHFFTDDGGVSFCFNPLRFGAGAHSPSLRCLRRWSYRVSIPFVSGREHSPCAKVALANQQHTVYFSRTSQNNVFLSPSPDSFQAPKTAPTPFLPTRFRYFAHPLLPTAFFPIAPHP